MSSSMIYHATLSTPAKFQFSYKNQSSSAGYYKFYVDGVLTDTHAGAAIYNFTTFTTDLLLVGAHTFEWKVIVAG